ncbi:hypothetical protein BD309DRAFT_949715, partial [Dichomitus squalens]
MPNRFQVAFLISFVATLFLLIVTTEFVKAKLHQRGIYVSDLILLGTGKIPQREPIASADIMSDVFSASYNQLIPLALALITSVLLYAKFGRGR